MPSPSEDIKSRLDLVELIQSYIRLAKTGVNYKANCPFHSEKTPSFVVSPVRQIWHCFGCNLGGDHFKFVMQIEGLEFPDALELLAKRAGVELKREDPRLRSERTRLYNIVEDAAKIFDSVLHSSPNPDIKISPPLAYLHSRGLTDEIIKNFRIGFAPESWDFLIKSLAKRGHSVDDVERAGLAVKSEQGSRYDRFRSRIVFPVADASGRIVGFSGRIFGDSKSDGAKYINTPQTAIYDKSRVLYGFDKAKEEIRKQNTVVLVEGQMDVVMSHQAGITNAVAVSGTALTSPQLQTLKRLASAIVSSFDRDAAGELATKRSLDLASSSGFERKVAMLPSGVKDPAEAVQKDPAVWQRAVAEAKPIVQYFLEGALGRHDRNSASGKRMIASEVLPEVRLLASEVEKAHWLQELSREIGIAEEALWRELKKTGLTAGRPEYHARGAEQDKAAEQKTPDTGRRWQLESLLLGTLIRYPERGSELPEVPRHAFLDERHIEMLHIVESAMRENVREHEALMAAIPSELREAANYLAFQAEVILERIENATERAREVIVFMRELEREWAKERLRSLSDDIKKAEAARNEDELQKLLEEFRTISIKLQ